MFETISTQFCLGNDNFPQELEWCCSIHSTAFKKGTKQVNDGKNDDDATNNEEGKDGFISAHIING